MSYFVQELITDAFYLANILARGHETLSGQQQTDGLTALNDMIALSDVDTGLIPYFQKYDFQLVANETDYFIDNLVAIETFTFFKNGLRYASSEQGRSKFYGSSRPLEIRSLPFNWHAEREKGGTTLSVFFTPEENYDAQIWGKFGLDDPVLNQDLELIYDRFYITYMKYALARFISDYYQQTLPPGIERRYQEIVNKMREPSPVDFDLNAGMPTGTFGSPLDTATLAFWRGFVP